MLDEPTRGVDVAAKREIYEIVRGLSASGMGIIFVSSELEEIHAVADRIVVFAKGQIAGDFVADQVTGSQLAAASSRLTTTIERPDLQGAN